MKQDKKNSYVTHNCNNGIETHDKGNLIVKKILQSK
jgi:hypothetical protein